MSYEVALTVGDHVLSKMPGFLLKRIYTDQRLKEEIKITSRNVNPILFCLGTYVPKLNAWFTISNFSNLVMNLQSFSADVWTGQPIATAVCFDRPNILRKRQSEVYAESFLSELQVSRIRELQQQKDVLVSLYVTAYLESKVGLLELKPTIDNCQVIIQ